MAHTIPECDHECECDLSVTARPRLLASGVPRCHAHAHTARSTTMNDVDDADLQWPVPDEKYIHRTRAFTVDRMQKGEMNRKQNAPRTKEGVGDAGRGTSGRVHNMVHNTAGPCSWRARTQHTPSLLAPAIHPRLSTLSQEEVMWMCVCLCTLSLIDIPVPASAFEDCTSSSLVAPLVAHS